MPDPLRRAPLVSYLGLMTVNAAQDVPQFDLADRLRKAREQAGLDQGELAHKLGIARTTVSAYESRNRPPSRLALIGWALLTGVPIEWLESGKAPGQGGDDGGVQPSDMWPALTLAA